MKRLIVASLLLAVCFGSTAIAAEPAKDVLVLEGSAVEVGKMASKFTQEALKDGFSVRTRWQGVFSGQKGARKYGIVSVGDQDLAEMLVANGLARIHGMGIRGRTWEEVERLKGLEAEARKAGKGAWGLGRSET